MMPRVIDQPTAPENAYVSAPTNSPTSAAFTTRMSIIELANTCARFRAAKA